MSLSNPLPQIIPNPTFPKVVVSKLAEELAWGFIHNSRLQRDKNSVLRVYKANYWGAVFKMDKRIVAVQLTSGAGEGWLFLREPEGIRRRMLFDRFNAILLLQKLPTLHQVSGDYWIFSDGVPWTGQRTLRVRPKPQLEKIILTRILNFHP